MDQQDKQSRINSELSVAGLSGYGLHRKASKELVQALRDDEHVEAAVFGRNENNWHALLVATDKRIVYIEADLLFHSTDSIAYEIVHGIDHIPTPFFDGIILYSLGKDYKVTHINKQSTNLFIKFIEDKVEKVSSLEKDFNISDTQPKNQPAKEPKPTLSYTLSNQDISILENNFILISAKPATSTTITFKKYYFKLYEEGLYAITTYLPSTPFGNSLSLPISAIIISQNNNYVAQLKGLVNPVSETDKKNLIIKDITKSINNSKNIVNSNLNYLVYKININSIIEL